MFRLLYPLVHALQPYLVPVCFCLTWGLIVLLGWTVWSAMRDSVAVAKRMHQIPCSNCQFFTDDYRLKCTVHPSIANSEAAINCLDYRSQTQQLSASRNSPNYF
ncbi:MAG: hypothetical protein LDL41_01005 [Coleofasciculus sp. S288]|nr:hypothetical protein [Coleofasciculus sp. S288]